MTICLSYTIKRVEYLKPPTLKTEMSNKKKVPLKKYT